MSPIWILSILLIKPSSSNFDCVVAYSNPSGTGDDDQISVGCADINDGAYPTMVSCGFRPIDPNDEHVDGAWMSDDGETCIAQNGQGGAGVTAIARYINLTYIETA